MIRVAVSGGFDPLHPGHIEYFRLAKSLGDYLIVIVNTDDWLLRKKGFIFMPLKSRVVMLEAVKYVDSVIVSIDTDNTVAETLRYIKPHIFGKGGDKTSDAVMPSRELTVCKEIGCKVVYGLGEKVESSSQLVKNTLTVLSEL